MRYFRASLTGILAAAFAVCALPFFTAPVMAQTAQALPYSYTSGRTNMTSANGWTYTGIGTDYADATTPIKFDTTGDVATLLLASAPNQISFYLKGNSFSGGTFSLLESSDGVTFTTNASYTTNITSANTQFTQTLSQSTRYVRWLYNFKALPPGGGNVGMGTISITPSSGPAIISFTPSSGWVGDTVTISGLNFGASPIVKFNGLTASATVNPAGTSITATVPVGASTGKITVQVAGQTTATSATDFTVVAPGTPVINLSTNTISGLNTATGTPSSATNYTVTGASLGTNPVVVTPDSPLLEVGTDGSTFSSTLSLAPIGGVVSNLVYLRVVATNVADTISAVVNHVSGAASRQLAVSGSITNSPPSLFANPPSLSGLSTTTNTPSAPQTFILTGLNLLSDVIAFAPVGFEIAPDGTSWGSSALLSQSEGSLNATISVRLAATNVWGLRSNNVVLQGAGVTNRVSVSGAVVGTPPNGLVFWDFSAATPTYGTDGAYAAWTFGPLMQGNNNGTTTLFTTTSPSSGYTNPFNMLASGTTNAGAAARAGVLVPGVNGSAYFQMQITVPSNASASITNISFGSRSTGTGPAAYAIRSGADNFASDIATGSISTNSTWSMYAAAVSLPLTNGTNTIRIYGYDGTNAGASTANWRIDDLGLALSAAVPSISVSTNSISGLTATQGSAGAPTNFTASGANLVGDIAVTASGSNFVISTNQGGGFTNSFVLVRNGAGLASTPIYVRLTGTNIGTFTNTVSLASSNATTQNVTVIGTVSAPPSPSLTATPAAITNLGTTAGTPSDAQAFTVSGTLLSNDITVSANDAVNFAVSTNSTSGFASSLVLATNGSGGVPSTPVYVRLTGAGVGMFNSIVSLQSGALSANVTVGGTVSSTNEPFVDVDPVSLSGFTALVGNASTNQSVSVAGLNVGNPVQITAVGPFEVSTNGTNFSSSVSVPLSGGVLTFTNSTNWVAPAGVSFVQVECWGAGGAGGSALRATTVTSRNYAGGGAGGAYAKLTNLPVVSGSTYAVNVGTGASNSSSVLSNRVDGGDSWFASSTPPTTNVLAKGGQGAISLVGDLSGSTVPTRFGAGGVGTATGSFGDIVFAGGSGSFGSETNIAGTGGGGGGGSSAGNSSTGASATSSAGAVSPAGGGNGGGGAIGSTNGTNGIRPGGGGGGGATTSISTLRSGGAGGNGQVVITAEPFFPATTIYVRMSSTAAIGANSGSLTITSIGAATRTVSLSGTVGEILVPAVTATPSSLSGFTTTLGVASTNQNFTVTGSNLTNNVVITPPSGFAVSTNGTTFSTNALTIPLAQFVSPATISVRLTGASAGSPSGNVTVASAGATTQNVGVSGTVNTPTVTASPASLTLSDTTVGTPSLAQLFNAGGSNLVADITVTAIDATNFAISTNAGSGFTTSLLLKTSGGIVAPTPVYVRLTATNAGTFSNNVSLASSNAITRIVAVSGTVTNAPAPAISLDPSSLTGFATSRGTPSSSKNVTVTGANLGGTNIAVTSSNNFYEISTNNFTSAGTNLILAPTGGVVAVRISTNAPASNSLAGMLVFSAAGATTNLSLGGTVTESALLTATPNALTNFSTVTGTASAAQSYALSGSNLSTVSVTAPAGFQVALTNTNSAFGSSVSPVPSGGVLNTNIFVRVSGAATTNANLTGDIANVSGTASTNVALQARVVPAPTLSAVPTALSNFSTIVGVVSTNQSFTLSANNLLGPVNLSVSNGYEMSLSANSGFATNLTVAAVSASDNAGNYTAATWTNGANGGTGFGPWVIAANSGTGFAGVFVGNPNAAGIATDGQFGTNAFGMYANPGPSGAFANADRSFPALLVGQTFSFQWGVNWDSDVGNKGFNIYAGGAGGTQLVNVNQSGFPGIITVNGANAISNYGSNAMTWSFTMTTPTNLLVSSTGRDGTTNIAFTTNITVAASPDAFRWYVSAMGAGDQRQPYFNNLRIAYTGGNISNLPVYVRIATNAPPAETTNSLLSRVTVSSTAVPQPSVVATAASSQIYNAYNDFYLSPAAAGWTGATNPSAAGAAWGYYMGNVNGNGGFPLKVGSYLTSGQLYKLSSVGPLSSDPTKYSTSLWDNTGGAGFPRYQANIPGWSTSLGSFSTPWFDGAPGFGTSLSNAIWLQSSYLGNTQPSPAGPAEGIASVLTWTAPVTGSYSFSGRFVAGNQPANSAAVSIVDSLGGTNLARTVLSNSSIQTISFTKSYNAGDTVQFQVGNNFSTGNAVGLQINVAPAAESSNVFAYVDLSGTVANRPSISLSTNAVSGLSATNGYPGVSTNFAVSGRSLTNDIVITVTPATNYQISADNSVFTNTLTLARSNGIVSSNTIYVRIAASAPVSTNPNSLPGNVAFVSPSASTNLSLSGRVFEDVSIPVVETGTNALAGLATVEGTASASTNFTVNGRYLRGNIVVTAPANFAVSTNNLNFAAGVQLPPGVDRIVPPTPVFVRIAENASAGAVTGNVVLNSSNLPAPANVLVSGTVTNWSVANPYGIRVTNPVDFVSTDKGNFTFSGQFGTALDSAMLSWFNLANGVSNGFTGNANRTWSTSVPLDAGINTLVFSGQYLTNAGTTNTAGDTAGDGAYGPPGGWVSGDNGGFGFGPWQLYSEDGLSALYRADVWSATNMNVSAFYGFAFESIVGGLASAHRPFAADLQAPGGSFSVYFDNNNVQPQGSVGLQLVSSNKTPLFTFSAVNDGSGPAYQIGNKTNSAIRPGWAYTQSGLLLRFEMTSSNGYVFTASGSNFTNTNTGTILSLPVAGVTFFADGAGPAPESNFYVGQMQQRRTIYQLETVSTVAPDVERTSPPTSAYKIWAQSFGLDPAGNGAPGADPDKDGYTNDMEFAFGTNPVVATTRPMLQARQSGADLVVSFLARNAGVSYAVLQKSNLAAASPAWADVAVSLVKDADQSGIADPVNYTRRSFTVPATGQNFYRVRATVSQ